MDLKYIQYEKKDGIATITLNTPKNLNALNVPTCSELLEALTDCEKDESIRAVIFTGAGRIFSSGGNIKEFKDHVDKGTSPKLIGDITGVMHPCAVKLATMPKPVICKIKHGAYGAGLSLALACDLVYASDDAILDTAFFSVGLTVDGTGTYSVPRIIGIKKAKEFFWLKKFSAIEAEEWGLINKAIPIDEIDKFVDDIAKRLANGPTLAIARSKTLLNKTFLQTIEQQGDDERTFQIEIAATDDFAEGVRAFLEKRAANFKGK
ncbi:MAG: enoyl-CoA hydratase/isomerase family protein [Candidatus Helarchaeota archaeon]